MRRAVPDDVGPVGNGGPGSAVSALRSHLSGTYLKNSRAAEEQVRREAARLIRSRARSFYLASLFLPASTRRDVQIVYAYYRTIDDLVDEPPRGWGRDRILAELARWDAAIFGGDDVPGPLCTELLQVASRHEIPADHLRMVILGARFDLDMRSIETREELIWYSVQVAGSVGMVMARILGTRSNEALDHACSLGVAMQLTNVLRDVAEDLDRGRVYLPLDDLRRSGCPVETLHRRALTPALRSAMEDLIGEARRLYRHGTDGIPHLDPKAQFAIYLAATLYGKILDKIAYHNYDVFAGRAHLGTVEKWGLAIPAYFHHRQVMGGR